MFMPTAEERKRLLRGTIPRARKLGVDDSLRGWSWSAPPLLSPYEIPLGLADVANAYCPTGRDVYARRVLGVEPEPNEEMILGGALHGALRDWIVHAKKTLYQRGAKNPEEAMREIRDFPEPDLPETSAIVSYEADAIEFRLREALSQFPRIGTDAFVASLLLMPLVKFVGPTDPRWLATMERIQAELTHDVLVNRYDIEEAAPDGLEGGEGTFSLCSFWLVECLTQAGRLEEARLALEKMFSYANHLELYAEEIGSSGEALGNFPQAFTHLALISATVHLNHALGHG
jgi:GH15 family glucan-1,4-alpha-glucosidase